jgi:hypothetical protein
MLTNDVQTGQRARVTLLADIIATDDDAIGAVAEQARREGKMSFPVPKKTIPAGAVYEGIVTDADSDGCFDLNLHDGEAIGFYAHGSCFLIELLA